MSAPTTRDPQRMRVARLVHEAHKAKSEWARAWHGDNTWGVPDAWEALTDDQRAGTLAGVNDVLNGAPVPEGWHPIVYDQVADCDKADDVFFISMTLAAAAALGLPARNPDDRVCVVDELAVVDCTKHEYGKWLREDDIDGGGAHAQCTEQACASPWRSPSYHLVDCEMSYPEDLDRKVKGKVPAESDPPFAVYRRDVAAQPGHQCAPTDSRPPARTKRQAQLDLTDGGASGK